MIHQPTERYKWFQSKIGKRLFRNETSCQCAICKDVAQNGLIVNDEMHADYLYDCEGESNHDGIPLRYFDSRQEVEDWLKTLPK